MKAKAIFASNVGEEAREELHAMEAHDDQHVRLLWTSWIGRQSGESVKPKNLKDITVKGVNMENMGRTSDSVLALIQAEKWLRIITKEWDHDAQTGGEEWLKDKET